MGQNRAFSAVFIFLALIFLLEIMSVGGRHLKFDSAKLNTYKTFLANEAKVVEGGSRLHTADIEAADADMRSPVTAPSTPISVVGASQALHGAYGEAAYAVQSPQPSALDYTSFLDPKKDPISPPSPRGNPPIHHKSVPHTITWT